MTRLRKAEPQTPVQRLALGLPSQSRRVGKPRPPSAAKAPPRLYLQAPQYSELSPVAKQSSAQNRARLLTPVLKQRSLIRK